MKFDKPAAKGGGKRKASGDKGKGGPSRKSKGGGKPRGKGGGPKGGGGKRPPRKPQNPFNNPFAALSDIKNN